MRKRTAALAAAIIAVLLVPAAGMSASDCAVVWDPAEDVAGPLGTPRPAQLSGANVDILGVSMLSSSDTLRVSLAIRNLSARPTAGTDGAFYGVFWSLGIDRYFAQATRVSQTGFQFQAGHAAGTDDHLPQQGLPVNGFVSARGIVRIDVPLALAGGPRSDELLQQVRARTEESALRSPETLDPNAPLDHVTTLSDAAGGLEGGRYLYGGVCLGLLSAAGERCIIASDSSRDAKAGVAHDATRGTDLEPLTRGTAYGAVDPGTEILSMQMGTNSSTLVVELGVASLRHPVPDGADAQRWEVTWTIGQIGYTAFAERRTSSHTFGYTARGRSVPTSGSISPASGTIRILVPRHEAGADGFARLVGIYGRSELVVAGVNRDWRDTAGSGFATQFVSGVSCAEQEKAACPVVLDATGDARVADPVTEDQPASDMVAGGAAAPLSELVLSVRVADIGAPPPDGFDRQGWTISWVYGSWRYFAQAERTARETVFRYGISGAAGETTGPVGPRFIDTVKADGVFDLRNGVIGITVPRGGIGEPADGDRLTELGVYSWVMKHGSPASPALAVDQTPLAPYRVGLACSA